MQKRNLWRKIICLLPFVILLTLSSSCFATSPETFNQLFFKHFHRQATPQDYRGWENYRGRIAGAGVLQYFIYELGLDEDDIIQEDAPVIDPSAPPPQALGNIALQPLPPPAASTEQISADHALAMQLQEEIYSQIPLDQEPTKQRAPQPPPTEGENNRPTAMQFPRSKFQVAYTFLNKNLVYFKPIFSSEKFMRTSIQYEEEIEWQAMITNFYGFLNRVFAGEIMNEQNQILNAGMSQFSTTEDPLRRFSTIESVFEELFRGDYEANEYDSQLLNDYLTAGHNLINNYGQLLDDDDLDTLEQGLDDLCEINGINPAKYKGC